MALPSAIILRGTRAGQPAATAVAAGTLYAVTDEGLIQERSTGAAWEAYSSAAGSGDVTASGTLTASRLMVGAGTTIISALGSLGTTTTLLHGNAAGAPTFGAVVEADITLADNTTNNAATTKHGLLKKLSNVATEYMDGTGAWSTPAGGGGGFGGIGTVVAPVDADFAWVNQNSATSTQVGDGVVLTGAAAGSGDWEWAMRVKSAPATPYTITAYIVPSTFRENFRFDGLIFRQSSDGKFAAFGQFWNSFAGTPLISVRNYSGPTAFNAIVTDVNWLDQDRPFWLQISDDGTDRYYRLSSNGVTWYQFATDGRTSYFTADQVGFGINRRTAGTAVLTLLSWEAS